MCDEEQKRTAIHAHTKTKTVYRHMFFVKHFLPHYDDDCDRRMVLCNRGWGLFCLILLVKTKNVDWSMFLAVIVSGRNAFSVHIYGRESPVDIVYYYLHFGCRIEARLFLAKGENILVTGHCKNANLCIK